MSDRPLPGAFDAGTVYVTPNRRLARHLVAAYDRAQADAGRRAWPSLRAMPWAAWCDELDSEATLAGQLPARLRLGEHAQTAAWRSIVTSDPMSAGTVDPVSVGRAAAEAWELVHAHGAGGTSWRAWAGGNDEPSAFARWAEQYTASLRRLDADDASAHRDILRSLGLPTSYAAGRFDELLAVRTVVRETGAEVGTPPSARQVESPT